MEDDWSRASFLCRLIRRRLPVDVGVVHGKLPHFSPPSAPHVQTPLRLSVPPAGARAVFKSEIRRHASRAAQLVVDVLPALLSTDVVKPNSMSGGGGGGNANGPSSHTTLSLPPSPSASSTRGQGSEAMLLWVVKQLLLHRHPYLALEVGFVETGSKEMVKASRPLCHGGPGPLH